MGTVIIVAALILIAVLNGKRKEWRNRFEQQRAQLHVERAARLEERIGYLQTIVVLSDRLDARGEPAGITDGEVT